ncbi:MAG: MATE family efflux transporter [Clostridium sp.]|nr:MATE family efflux transporter [Clostridium sp.]
MSRIEYYKSIVKLGLPILVGQVGMIIVGFADNVMVGRYSTGALASASFVNGMFNWVIFCCIGFTYGVLPLAGAIFGKNDGDSKREIGSLMRRAVTFNVLFALALTALMAILYFNLHRLGQPAELLPLIRPYYILSLCGMLPISLFNVFAQWSYSIKNTTMPMWIILASNALNIAGNYALIYGKWGFPELGLAGAGISTMAARLICPLIIMSAFFFFKRYREYRLGFSSAHPSAISYKKIWVTSMPISLQMAFESGSFSIAAVMAGWLGAIQLAAFQIIVIVGTLGFVLYYAIGSAIAVLVSNEAGKHDPASMRRAGWCGYHVMLLMTVLSSLAFIIFAKDLIGWFTEDPLVLSATIALIFPLVLYQLGDATQITFANALRGTSQVMPMLWIAFVSYMIIGVPATYILAFTAGLGLYGIILSFSISLFLAGALFLRFFLRATK